MNSVFLLCVGWHYEGSTAIKAFAHKAAADALADQCREYQATKPHIPNTDEDSAKWDKWSKADELWRSKHPGGDDACSAEYFNVIEVPFDGRPTAKGAV